MSITHRTLSGSISPAEGCNGGRSGIPIGKIFWYGAPIFQTRLGHDLCSCSSSFGGPIGVV